jgi:hypothetical protein
MCPRTQPAVQRWKGAFHYIFKLTHTCVIIDSSVYCNYSGSVVAVSLCVSYTTVCLALHWHRPRLKAQLLR